MRGLNRPAGTLFPAEPKRIAEPRRHQDLRFEELACRLMEAFRRAVGAAFFDRKSHTQILFDSSATADAVMVVGAVGIVISVAGWLLNPVLAFDLVPALLSALIAVLAQWLFQALATWLVGTKLFRGNGDPQTVMRLHGHAYLPLVLTAFGTIAAVIGALWFLAALVVATSVALGLNTREGGLSVLVGYAVVFLVALAFRAPFVVVSALLP